MGTQTTYKRTTQNDSVIHQDSHSRQDHSSNYAITRTFVRVEYQKHAKCAKDPWTNKHCLVILLRSVEFDPSNLDFLTIPDNFIIKFSLHLRKFFSHLSLRLLNFNLDQGFTSFRFCYQIFMPLSQSICHPSTMFTQFRINPLKETTFSINLQNKYFIN